MSAALAFDGIWLQLGTRSVLRGADLELSQGELVGLIGANGAGKTTLLRVGTRVLRADAGRVHVGGVAIEQLSRRALARALAIVPQDTQIPFPFRVGELVLMGRSPHLGLLGFEGRADVDRARDAMERVGISELADRTVFDLSGGERQLVMVARALTQDPSVLLMDEPTAFLDLRHRIDVLRVVRDFVSRGRSAIVVSHDLNLAARYCDRIALLTAGRVRALGPPAEVLTAALLEEAYGIEVHVATAPDGAPVIVAR